MDKILCGYYFTVQSIQVLVKIIYSFHFFSELFTFSFISVVEDAKYMEESDYNFYFTSF